MESVTLPGLFVNIARNIINLSQKLRSLSQKKTYLSEHNDWARITSLHLQKQMAAHANHLDAPLHSRCESLQIAIRFLLLCFQFTVAGYCCLQLDKPMIYAPRAIRSWAELKAQPDTVLVWPTRPRIIRHMKRKYFMLVFQLRRDEQL